MQAPKIPSEEFARLMALHRLNLLDTPPSAALDRITSLAARIMDVPILLVSLIDEDRQWFKSCVGLDVAGTSREISFCGHAVFDRAPLIVRNASEDARFADNPLVTGEPGIRAYLGIPLFTRDGHAIGTLCAIDRRARDFSVEEIDTMTAFARIAEEDINSKAMIADTQIVLQFARSRDRQFRDTFEHSAVGMLHIGMNGRVLRSNSRAGEILGHCAEDLRAASFLDYVHVDDCVMDEGCFLQMIEGAARSTRGAQRPKRKDGSYLTVLWTIEPKFDDAGKPDYAVAVIEDVALASARDNALA